ncbi:MAG: glycoside hydrolase/phage tail family protein, partial [Pseudomonadota bacterium]
MLHCAALCKAAGGVSAFCIGSEMRALTQIRGEAGFPAVEQLKELAGEVRAILGSDARLGYAADWSEYYGYQPTDGSGDRYFHLDPLWSDDNIDFVGIDNYMPLSDWRDGDDHVDAAAGAPSIYDLDYLRSNVEGGEGYDWYYASPDAEDAQNRTPITDEAHDEPWVWRYKDIRNWWSNPHHERIGGERQVQQTSWMPQSKPVWFTEFGCAAIDKGTNQPNKFLDPKSSESKLPKYSNGLRDDLIQIQYLRAVIGHWSDPDNNPVSTEYGGPMLDLSNAYVWTWDARPYPAFPNRRDLWNDGGNYTRGHWLTGRSSNRTLSSVVAEICLRAGLVNFDVRQLWGVVRGYSLEDVADARSALQPLMLRYGFDAIERDGTLVFKMRTGKGAVRIDPDLLAVSRDVENSLIHSRDPDAEMAGRVRLRFVQSGADHDVVSEEAILPSDETHAVASSEMALSMTRTEGRQTAERWLAEARLARETAQFALPPSHMLVRAGDIVSLPMADGAVDVLFRVDRVEQSDHQILEAVRIEPNVFAPSEMPEDQPVMRRLLAPVPVLACFLDLPLLTGDEIPHAPLVAATSRSWPGGVTVYSSSSDDNYALNTVLPVPAIMGHTENTLSAAPAGLWDRNARLQVRLVGQALESRTREAVLNGANLAAIGDGSNGNWELIQFQSAELIGPDTYLLTNLLRGQAGSDALMPDLWPAESKFVLIDPRVVQIGLSSAERRIERHYRIGPSQRSYDDPAYTHHVEAFDGNGLRPYAPVHLRAVDDSGAQAITWIRRSRIDGDDWSLPD